MGQYYRPIIGHKENGKFVIDAAIRPLDYDNGMKLMEHSYIGNAVTGAIENLLGQNGQFNGSQLVWAGDYADNEKGRNNLYDLCVNSKCIKNVKSKHYRYAVNVTKGEYVNMDKVQPDTYGYRIHPIPLLCAEGNGRGCGDYHGTQIELIGTWARDEITFTDNETDVAKLKELDTNFKEE